MSKKSAPENSDSSVVVTAAHGLRSRLAKIAGGFLETPALEEERARTEKLKDIAETNAREALKARGLRKQVGRLQKLLIQDHTTINELRRQVQELELALKEERVSKGNLLGIVDASIAKLDHVRRSYRPTKH